MSTVNIKKPIVIELEVNEIDNYLPSIKMAVKIEIIHPTGSYLYQANDIWFECAKWDAFLSSLNQVLKGDSQEAKLENMSNSFSIKLLSSNDGLVFNFEGEEVNVGNGTACLRFTSFIDQDILGNIEREFLSLEKWW